MTGGEDAALAVDAIRGQEGIWIGSISTTGTYTYPSATIAAWDAYIATATATATVPSSAAAAAATVLGTPTPAVAARACAGRFCGLA